MPRSSGSTGSQSGRSLRTSCVAWGASMAQFGSRYAPFSLGQAAVNHPLPLPHPHHKTLVNLPIRAPLHSVHVTLQWCSSRGTPHKLNSPLVASQYATWEEQQKDFRRARSVWERALAIEYRNVSLWLKVRRDATLGIGDRYPARWLKLSVTPGMGV